jgi:putative acetyltransferase
MSGRILKKMEIRPIKASESLAVKAIIYQVMTEFGTIGPGYSINDPEVEDMFQAYQDSDSLFLVISDGESVYGGGGIAPLAGDLRGICELKKMYFLPEVRGKGFGRKMIQALLQAAQERKYEQCYLETVERMKSANGLYQKMGFQALNQAMGNTGHCSCDSYYVKKLNSVMSEK